MGLFDDIRSKIMGGGKPEQPGAEKQPTSAQDQSQEDRDLAAFVRSRVEEARSQAARVAHEGIWMTNIAYILGYDGVFYDPTQRQFRPVNPGTRGLKRNRMHENIILPAVQNRLARMLKNPPRYDVFPNSKSEEDKEGARLGVDVIDGVWNRQRVNRKRIDLGMWIQQCGHSYIGVLHDDELGEPLVDPVTGELIGYSGDTRIDVVSAFEGFPDPLAKTFEECGWFVRAKVRRLDYFRNHYERGDLVKEEGAWLLSSQYEMRINTLSTAGGGSTGTADQMKNAAIELSYYEPKSKKYREGRHVIVANGILLKNKGLPYGEIPYAKFDDIIVAGKYNSEAAITHARPLQDQHNRTLTKRSEWTNKLLTGKYIAARGHGLTQEAINDQSGEVVEFDPVPNTKEPHAMQIPVIPQYAYTETETLKHSLNENMGNSDISRGVLPSASIPAKGMDMLLEQDETRMGIEVEQHEHAWARVGQLILKCEAKNTVMPKKLKSRKKNADYDIREYDGSMLKRNFDVTVVRGSTLPNNKILKRQEVLNAYSQGLLGDPNDPAVREKVLGMLEYGDVGEIWTDYHLDMNQIKESIAMIEAEEQPPVNMYDNHAMHIIHKNRFRKSEKFATLSPISQGLLQQDLEEHAHQGGILANPQLMHPPDAGPDPEEAMRLLQEQAKGVGLDNLSQGPQNNMQVA